MLDKCNFDGELKETARVISHGGFGYDPNYLVMEDLKDSLVKYRLTLGEDKIVQIVTKMEIDVSEEFVKSEIYKDVIHDIMNTICNMHTESKRRGLEAGIVDIITKRLKLVYHKNHI